MKEHENPWQTLTSNTVYENPWISVTHSDVITPTGTKGVYGIVHFKHLAIGIVPLDEEMNTILVGQFRYPLNRYSWEIPEGGGKLDQEPLESAKRELLEETGLKATHWNKILEMDLSNSVSDEVATIFVARGLTQHEAQPEETEQLQLRKLPFSDAFEMVMNGEITDSLTVAGILKTKWLLDNGRLESFVFPK